MDLHSLRRCRHCGRPSLLHTHCPDCGKALEPLFRRNVCSHLLLAAVPVLLILILQIRLIFHSLASSPLWQWGILLASLLIHIGGVYLCFRLRQLDPEHPGIASPLELIRFRLRSGHTLEDLARCCRFPELARDAYHLDLEWLNRQIDNLPQGDMAARARLLEQAVRLSRFCDTPLLAGLRLRILARGLVCDGDRTDIDAISAQIFTLPPEQWLPLLSFPGGIRTFCDCLCLDALGPEPERIGLCCDALEYLADHCEDRDQQAVHQALALYSPCREEISRICGIQNMSPRRTGLVPAPQE